MKKCAAEDFIKRAKEKFGDRFDYSKVNYVDSRTKVCIVCPEHGEFWINPSTFLNSSVHGCPECSGLKKWDTRKFIEKAKEVHGGKYNYAKTVYVNKRTNVEIICPLHGSFWQNPHNHIFQLQGCPECGKRYAKEWRKGNYQEFIEESRKRFGDIYEFPNVENLYENSHSKILVKCRKCGNVFEKIACDHLTSSHGGCLHCYANKSKGEEEIGEYIKSLIPEEEVILRTRSLLKNSEIDIYIPSRKLAFEYNGVFWHSEKNHKGKNYHLFKTEECKNLGVNLIHIFEDEYIEKKEIVLSKIKYLLNKSDFEKVYARKCNVKEISFFEAEKFLNKNHIQGPAKSSVYLGLFYGSDVVSVMTFLLRDGVWELNRFASDIDKIVVGAGGKLFTYFKREYKPTKVKSFADRRWTVDREKNLYTTLGFKFEKYTAPDYKYHFKYDIARWHKFNFRKQILHRRYGFPLTMTEAEMVNKMGASKVYDCGLIKYVWEPKIGSDIPVYTNNP